MISEVTRAFLNLYLTKPGGAGPIFEELLRTTYEAVLKDGDTALDCGANYGMHTIPMARASGAGGRVHAFEPLAAAIQGIRQKLKAQDLLQRVELHQIALSDENGTLEFRRAVQNPALSSLRATRHHANQEIAIETVETRRLDDFYCGDPPRFMKIDVEGAEYYLLCGAKKLIRESKPIIAFENGRHESARSFGYSKADFFGLFEELDYSMHFITGDRFESTDWSRHPTPWYYLAAPRESAEVLRLTEMLRARTREYAVISDDRSEQQGE